MLIDTSAEQSASPVRIVEIHRYQGRQSEREHVIYKADTGWYFLKADIDSGASLRPFLGLDELQAELGEPLRLLVRHQVIRSEQTDKPIALKKLFARGDR